MEERFGSEHVLDQLIKLGITGRYVGKGLVCQSAPALLGMVWQAARHVNVLPSDVHDVIDSPLLHLLLHLLGQKQIVLAFPQLPRVRLFNCYPCTLLHVVNTLALLVQPVSPFDHAVKALHLLLFSSLHPTP